jgi:cellobiose phosphorylase
VEPYVVCADIYGAPPHVGRGGWTWYTGAAGWLYRVAVEAIIGLRVRGESLSIDPSVAAAWPGFEIAYRRGSTNYQVRVDNSSGTGRGVRSVTVDGKPADGLAIPLHDDGRTHDVRVVLG